MGAEFRSPETCPWTKSSAGATDGGPLAWVAALFGCGRSRCQRLSAAELGVGNFSTIAPLYSSSSFSYPDGAQRSSRRKESVQYATSFSQNIHGRKKKRKTKNKRTLSSYHC